MTRFRALKNPNYRLYFYGQIISMAGTWMQNLVVSWLVYRLTGSAFWLGVTTFAQQFTAFALSPLSGVMAERIDRRRLLIWIELAATAQALALAALTHTGTVQIWQIVLLAAFLGLITAFDITTRHTFAFDLVGREDLSSAIAINSTTINLSRVLGPSLAGVLIAALGPHSEVGSFLINAASYLILVVFLLRIRTQSTVNPTETSGRFTEALTYVRDHPQIRTLMLLAFLMSLLAFPYTVLLPVISQDLLHGDAKTLAWLSAAAGMGAVFGSLGAGGSQNESRAQDQALERELRVRTGLLGASLLAFAFSTNAWFSAAACMAVGYFLMGAFPRINNAIQQAVANRLRARVISLYTMTFLGAVPLGSLISGWLADRFGVVPVLAGAGLGCLAVSAIRLKNPPQAATLPT